MSKATDIKPEIVSTEDIYQARVFTVQKATIREGETTYTREIITHPGSAVVVPVFSDNTVALVRQYRHPTGKRLLELPAGSLAPGENPQTGAERELEEEIGVRAGRVEKLTEFYVSPGFLAEKMHVYLATELIETRQNLEEDEILIVERVPLTAVNELIVSNQIEDAKTMIGLMLAAARLGVNTSLAQTLSNHSSLL